MGIHVGYDSNSGKVCVYDNTDKTCNRFKVHPISINTVEKEIKLIKSKINGGGLGCFCVIYDGKDYKLRELIMEYGKFYGFFNVEIIDKYAIDYIGISLQKTYKPINGDEILIFDEFFCHKWIKENDKATKKSIKRLSKTTLENYARLKNLKPDAISWKYIDSDILNFAIEKLPHCFLFVPEHEENIADIAMIKARITKKDKEYAAWDVRNILSWDVIVRLGEKEIMRIKKNQLLPLKNSKKIKVTNGRENILTIIVNDEAVKRHVFKTYDTFDFTISIDSNAIIAFDTSENIVIPLKKDELDGINGTFTSKEEHSFYTIPKKISVFNNIDAVGIDLGTSRCGAAVRRVNGIETVALCNDGHRLLPSFVAYDEKHVKCGDVVVQRLRNHSKSTIFDSKRIIGRNFKELEIDNNWPFKIFEKNGNIFLGVTSSKGEKYVTPEEVAASLLKHIKQQAEEFQGKRISSAVITVPARFSDVQKNSTIAAAELAGFQRVKLLPESIAASFAYFVDRPIPNNSNVLLFDLGGGTLDVCIFKIQNDQIQIIYNGGDSKLGGRDFDNVLINYFKNLLITNHGISLIKDKKFKLLLDCQQIKQDLTFFATSSLDVSDFNTNIDGFIKISREEFENMATQLLNKIKNTINAALYNSGYKANQIDNVLQVGGGSRMPMVKNMLKELFPQAKHCCEEHPDEVVAVGAAYFAYNIFKSQ